MRLCPSDEGLLIAGTYLAITFITSDIDFAIGDCPLDTAIVFMRVRAIGKTARIDKRADVSKISGDFFGDNVPQLKLANAGRVDQMTAAFKRNQFSAGCICRPF